MGKFHFTLRSGHDIKVLMRIISPRTLKTFYEQPAYAVSKPTILTWVSITKDAKWSTPIDVKLDFPQTDILKDSRAVFDLGGNKWRLIAKINYSYQIVYVRFIGTHKQYDDIDADTI